MTPPPAQINLFTKEAEIKKLARKLSQGWGICSLFELRNGAHVQKECPIQVIGTGTGEATVVTPDYFNCPGHKERK